MSHAAIVRAHGVGRSLLKPRRAMAQSKQIGRVRRAGVPVLEVLTLSTAKMTAIPVIMPPDDEHDQREDPLCR